MSSCMSFQWMILEASQGVPAVPTPIRDTPLYRLFSSFSLLLPGIISWINYQAQVLVSGPV